MHIADRGLGRSWVRLVCAWTPRDSGAEPIHGYRRAAGLERAPGFGPMIGPSIPTVPPALTTEETVCFGNCSPT